MIDIRYYRLSKAIEPYFTALYSFTVDCGDAWPVEDFLHPEWASMRFTQAGTPPEAAVVPELPVKCADFVASGPTSRAIEFVLSDSRVFGLGLQPAGWARFVDVHASELTNTIINGFDMEGAPFARFHPLMKIVKAGGGDHDQVAREMDSFLMKLHEQSRPAPERVLICQEALKDPEMADVDQMVERTGISRRTLERLCLRYFGFSPKTLLRRQRFLRSLGRFMLDSPDSWSDALDGQYHDQAHFVRDFRSFMGMTPTEYAEKPHPVLDRINAQRMVDPSAPQRAETRTALHLATQEKD